MEPREWYVEVRGVRSGPLPRAMVEGLRQRGLLGPDSPVWREGMPAWQPLAAAFGERAEPSQDAAPSAGVAPPPPSPAAAVVPPPPLDRAPGRGGVLGYVRRHWRGELSLPVSYWVNGTLLSVPIAGVIVGIGLAAAETRRPGLLLLGVSSVLLLVLATSIWQLVGIWRSSDAHVRRTGRSGWSGLAKAMCVLGVAQLALATWNSVGDLSLVWRYRGAVDAYAGFQVAADARGEVITARGPIGVGYADAVVAALDANPRARRLRIDSEGGLVHEALKAAEAVAARGMDVEIEGQCSSACIALFAVGRRRIVHEDAVMLLHAVEPVVADPGVAGAERALDEEREAYGDLLLRHGIPGPVVERWRALRDGAAEDASVADLLAAGTIEAVVVDGREVPAEDYFPTAIERLVPETPALAPTVRYLRSAQRHFPLVYREVLARY